MLDRWLRGSENSLVLQRSKLGSQCSHGGSQLLQLHLTGILLCLLASMSSALTCTHSPQTHTHTHTLAPSQRLTVVFYYQKGTHEYSGLIPSPL